MKVSPKDLRRGHIIMWNGAWRVVVEVRSPDTPKNAPKVHKFQLATRHDHFGTTVQAGIPDDKKVELG